MASNETQTYDHTSMTDGSPEPNAISNDKVNAELQARFGSLEVFKEPRCLVENVIDGKTKKYHLRINEDVLSQILEIDVPISVVGICGVYRTGKSYLMNRLAEAGKGLKGFVLGGTVSSVTKGIWVLCKVHPKHPNQVLILLDTEGLSDAEKGDEEHDMKLFCLTMLMSSVLIYNMRGVIDHEALKKLSFITDVTKIVTVSDTFETEYEEKQALKVISPHFVFCLRDFFFDLEKSTDDQYMESCLKVSDATNKLTNDIRRSIKDFFPERKCFTISMPATNTKKLQRLGNLSEEELSDEFRTECQNMTAYIHGLGPKVLDHVTNLHWVGKSFASFLNSYVEALSMDMKMDFGNAMAKAGETHNKELVGKYVQEFKTEIEQEKLPKPRSELFDSWMDKITSLLGELRMKLYPYELELFEDKAMKKMKKILDDLVSTNSDKQKEICFDYLSKEYDEMMKGNQAKYENDYTLYEMDFAKLLENYKETFEAYNEGRHTALRMFEESSKVLSGQAEAKMKAELKKLVDENKRRERDIQVRAENAQMEIRKEQLKQAEAYLNKFQEYVSDSEKRAAGARMEMEKKLEREREANDRRMEKIVVQHNAESKEHIKKLEKMLEEERARQHNAESKEHIKKLEKMLEEERARPRYRPRSPPPACSIM